MSGYKTVLEAAGELGMTKNALKYWLRKHPPAEDMRDEQGRILVPDEWIAFIRQNRAEPPENREEPPTEEPKNAVLLPGALSDTLALLRAQLEAKDAQIEALTNALRGEQALHAQTRQDLTAAREELRLLQAPPAPPQTAQQPEKQAESAEPGKGPPEEPQEPHPEREPETADHHRRRFLDILLGRRR